MIVPTARFVWSTSRRIIRANVETDKGSRAYTFSGFEMRTLSITLLVFYFGCANAEQYKIP
jgi:hypothetical protein